MKGRTSKENMEKCNSEHFKINFFTWNEASKKVQNRKESPKFVHE